MPAALSLAYTATPLAAGTKLVIEATGQVSAGKSFMPRSAYKTILVTAAAAASPANLLAAYNALFGSLVAGKKVFIRAYPVSSGGIRGDTIEAAVVIA